MKSEKIYTAIGQIDDVIISEANTTTKLKSNKPFVKWVAIAASIALIFSFVLYEYNQSQNNISPNLPMLSIGENTMGSFGFEGYKAYDILELSNNNPWSESVSIKTLPVFKNTVLVDGAGMPLNGLSVDEMKALVIEAAKDLNVDIDEVVVNSIEEQEVVGKCDGMIITATIEGDIKIEFENPIPLPKDYSFTYNTTTYDEAIKSTEYLLKEYKDFVGMKSPSLSLLGDYNINGERGFSYEAFESDGNIEKQIINFSFNRVEFSPNADGNLWIIKKNKFDLSEKIGDYPVISSKKAEELLLDGKYSTSVPYKMTDKDLIAKVELIYRVSRYEEYFMPYYRFYVELPVEKGANDLKTYGAYYVPAVEGQYISNMPTYDGRFD